MRVLLVLCLLAVPPVLGQVSDDCMYYYLEQPRSETDCNPYEGVLLLRCRALGALVPAFSIEWYRQDLTSAEVMLSATREPETDFGGSPQPRQMRSVLEIAPEDAVTARYWCQIRVNEQLLQRSREIDVQSPFFYNGESLPACSQSNAQSMFEDPPICADLNQTTSEPPPSQTSSPVTATIPTDSSPDPDPSSPPSPPGPDSSPSSVSLATHTPMPTSTRTPPEGDEDQSSGSNASFEILYVVIAVTAVLAIVVLIVSIAITIVVWRRRKLKGSASLITRPQQQPRALSVGHNHPPSPVEMAEYEDPDSINPVYYNLVPESEKREEEREGDYQSLNPETVDYISMYVTADIQRKGPPLVEVGGKEYCIIDKTKLDPPSLYGTAESL